MGSGGHGGGERGEGPLRIDQRRHPRLPRRRRRPAASAHPSPSGLHSCRPDSPALRLSPCFSRSFFLALSLRSLFKPSQEDGLWTLHIWLVLELYLRLFSVTFIYNRVRMATGLLRAVHSRCFYKRQQMSPRITWPSASRSSNPQYGAQVSS